MSMSTSFTATVLSLGTAIATSMSFAIFAVLSLATTSIALIVAAINPAMSGRAIAAVAGLLILAVAAVVTAMSVAYRRFDTIATNDDWVYW
jgi:drug/metabolite transporter superfamily protein YnfA